MHAYFYIIDVFHPPLTDFFFFHAVMKMLSLKMVRLAGEGWMPPLKEGVGTPMSLHPSQVLNQMIALNQIKLFVRLNLLFQCMYLSVCDCSSLSSCVLIDFSMLYCMQCCELQMIKIM